MTSASSKSITNLRLEALQAYGGKCACCGETAVAFLTFDHISPLRRNIDQIARESARMRKELRELRNSNWPPCNIQILCMNCNFSKGSSDFCAHSKDTVEEALQNNLREKRGRKPNVNVKVKNKYIKVL